MVLFYEDIQDLLELTPKKDFLFLFFKFIFNWRIIANKVLPGEHTGYSKHPLPTTQEKTLHMDITIWSTSKSLIIREMQIKTSIK